MRLRLTVTYDYDADPNVYDSADPLEAARIDQEAFRDDYGILFDHLAAQDEGVRIDVAPIASGMGDNAAKQQARETGDAL